MDYYSILEINKNASDNEIRKAYKKMALKYHPDKNNVDTTSDFQLISEAYQTLIDEDKRKDYDRFGKIPENFDNPHEIFSKLFKHLDPKLSGFLEKYLGKFATDLMDENKDVGDIISNNYTNELIDNGIDVIKHFIKKNNSKDKFFVLRKTLLELDTINEILIDLNFLRKYSSIHLIIEKLEFFFDLRKNSHIVTIENIEYTFILKLKYPNNIFRIEDSSDLCMIYNVGIEDYKKGFTFKIEDRYYNIDINGINIVKIAEEGIYNNHDGKLGHLYLIIQPILNYNLNQFKNSSFKTITSIKINELYK